MSSAQLSAQENFFLKKHHKREAIRHLPFVIRLIRYPCATFALEEAIPILYQRYTKGSG